MRLCAMRQVRYFSIGIAFCRKRCRVVGRKIMIKNIVIDIGNVLVRFQPDEAMREIGIEENK